MKEYNRICARVDLDAVEYNIERMRQNIREDAAMLAVVKMDGYGHGAVPIAKMLEKKAYIWGCAVATPEEASILKRLFISSIASTLSRLAGKPSLDMPVSSLI